jgi:hypothetical protein
MLRETAGQAVLWNWCQVRVKRERQKREGSDRKRRESRDQGSVQLGLGKGEMHITEDS